jgi:hypothetical protein
MVLSPVMRKPLSLFLALTTVFSLHDTLQIKPAPAAPSPRLSLNRRVVMASFLYTEPDPAPFLFSFAKNFCDLLMISVVNCPPTLARGFAEEPSPLIAATTIDQAGSESEMNGEIVTPNQSWVSQADTSDMSKDIFYPDGEFNSQNRDLVFWVWVKWLIAGVTFILFLRSLKLLKLGKMVEEDVQEMSRAHKVPANKLRPAYIASARASSDPESLEQILHASPYHAHLEKLDNLRVSSGYTFAKALGSQLGDVFIKLVRGEDNVIRAQIFVKEGAEPGALLERAMHLQQLSELDWIPKFAQLTEDNLTEWQTMSPERQLQLYVVKLEIEIDAQHRLLQVYDDSPKALNRTKLQHKLLQERLEAAEVALQGHVVSPPDWLDPNQPPRLFPIQ